MPALKPLPATLALAAILVLGSTAALLYTGTSRAADEAPAEGARPALTVSTAQPQRGAVPLRLAANGNVAAWQEASIGAESNGLRLDAVLVNVGDVVKAGQVLARIDAWRALEQRAADASAKARPQFDKRGQLFTAE